MLNPASDVSFMQTAISLSQRGKGRTGANPNVGCVVVKDGIVVARGWTQKGGRPHAEAMALEQAGKAAEGADIYVTLEPCAHISERGPACAELVAKAKPARIVIAALDPDERTRRKGVDYLGQAGIGVSVGLLESQARQAMAGFFSRMEQGRPHVTLKLALSLDGCIAMTDGSSKWITGARARAHTHLERARCDAILVGSGTAKADKPGLDVRLDGLEGHSPLRAVLGSSDSSADWVSVDSPKDISKLAEINWLLVEGGASTAASFLRAGLVDRLLLYRAPIIIGAGLSAVGNTGLEALDAAHGQWQKLGHRKLGQDVLEIYERAA